MIKVDCKEGVWFKFISYEFLTLARIFCRVYERRELVPTVTSACDSKHQSDSWHYKGLGWDWRIWGVDDPKTLQNEVKEVADEIRREAQAIDYHYDIVYADVREDGTIGHLDHIHSEYDIEKKRA